MLSLVKNIPLVGCAALALLMGCAESPPPESEFPEQYRPPRPVASADQNRSPEQESGASDEVAIGADPSRYADSDPAALTEFRDVLAPYGTWENHATYGTVWVPSRDVVGPDFAPYVTAGRWTYEREYVWVSDYSWGWVPFHYGRWLWIAGRGWAWIPGRTYAGAWVAWRVGEPGWDYVGWAPLPPTWYWFGGIPITAMYLPSRAYIFCPTPRLFAPNPASYVVAAPRVAEVAARTRPYVPASPHVAGAGGRALATPVVAGPPPHDLRISPASVPSPPANHPGLAQARALATPSARLAAPAGLAAPSVRPATSVRAGAPAVLGGSAPVPTPSRSGPPPVFGQPSRTPAPVWIPPSSSTPAPGRAPWAPLPPMSSRTGPPPAIAPVAPAPRPVAPAPPGFTPYSSPAYRPPTFSRPPVFTPHVAPAPVFRPPPVTRGAPPPASPPHIAAPRVRAR